MGGFNPLDIVAPGLDAVAGVINAKQARDAFKNRYQDTVRDMKKAGLNPALAYGQGGGNPQTHDIPELGSSVTKAVGTAASAAQANANMELTKAQTKLLNRQADALALKPTLENQLIGADVTQRGTETQLTKEDIKLRQGQQGLTGAQTAVEQKRLDQMDVAIQGAQLDQAWTRATWEDRFLILAKQLEKAGLEVTQTSLQNAALRAGLPKQELLGNAATGAQQLLETLANPSGPDGGRTMSEIFHDAWNKYLHQRNQQMHPRGAK
ncbi:MAG: DNA pilot protein [Microvirus sp.]|nr:MAG: DNA pilot protein [Microvirus sp.]